MSIRRSRGIFITGTDTSVGKTFIAAGLAFYLAKRNLSVGVMKPVQTGSSPTRGSFLSGDALVLSLAAKMDVPDSSAARTVCPYSFPEPIAPLLAARKHRRPIRFDTIQKAFRAISKHHNFIVVEGAGGLLSPFSPTINSLTLALGLQLPLLIVVENRIGALNQAFLTIEKARSSGAEIAGILFNRVNKNGHGLVKKNNPGIFREFYDIPVWGSIPFFSSRSGKNRWAGMEKYFRKELVRNGILKSL